MKNIFFMVTWTLKKKMSKLKHFYCEKRGGVRLKNHSVYNYIYKKKSTWTHNKCINNIIKV